MNNESSVFSDDYIRPEIAVVGAKDSVAKFFGLALRIKKIQDGSAGFETDLFLIELEDLNESTQ